MLIEIQRPSRVLTALSQMTGCQELERCRRGWCCSLSYALS